MDMTLDFRQGRQFSSGAWISLIWIAIGASRPIASWVHPNMFVAFSQDIGWAQGSIETVQNNPLDRNILIVLMVLGLVALISRRDQFQLNLSDNSWLIAFFALCLISIFWSEYPGIILKRWIRLAGDVIVILLILSETDPQETIYRIIRRMAILFLPLSILLIKFYGQLGRAYTLQGTQMWVGVTGHKNQLGMLCAITGIVLVWRNLTKWPKVDWLDTGLLALAVYLLLGSRSSTSAIVFLLGNFLLVLQFRMKGDVRKLNRAIIIGLILLLIFQGVVIFFLDQSLMPAFFSAAGRDSSLTGRVPLWQKLIAMGGRAPLLGCGFTCFWLDIDRVAEIWKTVGWAATSAHNGYLEIFLDLGIVGLIILFFLLAQTYRNIMRSFQDNPELGKLKLVLFAMVFFHNFTESTLAKANSLLWLLFLLSSIVVRTKPSQASDLAP
jgi:exopolysaccharide production protein ExoQ